MTNPKATINVVFASNYERLVRWCSKRLDGRVCDPEDLVHGAYLRCWKSWRQDRASAVYPAAYVFRTLRWVLLDELRRYARNRPETLPPGEVRTIRRRGDDARELMFREAVAALPKSQRMIVEEILMGKTLDQIGDEHQLSPAAMAVRLSRAKKFLERESGFSRGKQGTACLRLN